MVTTNPYLANLPRGAGLVSNSIGSVGQPMAMPSGPRYAGPTTGNPYTPSWFNQQQFGDPQQQATQAIKDSLQQGFTMPQIAQGAADKFGVGGIGFDMAATPLVQQAIRESMGQGFSLADTRKGAMEKFGLSGDAFDFAQRSMMPAPIPGLGGGTAQAGGAGGLNGNPYLGAMADDMTRRVNQNLAFSVMPSLRSQFIGAGGYGGSRQGIAEGVASGLASQGLAGSIAGLYGGAYESDQNRQMQRQQMDMQDRQFGQQFGLNSNIAANNATLSLYDKMLQGAGVGVDASTATQNAPMNYFGQFMNAANSAGGQGGSATQPFFGNPFLGALGGWQLGSSLFGGNKP